MKCRSALERDPAPRRLKAGGDATDNKDRIAAAAPSRSCRGGAVAFSRPGREGAATAAIPDRNADRYYR